MRLVLFALLAAFTAGCGHSHDSYASFQACFDEHTEVEGYDAPMAITICTLDHDIDGAALDFATVEECIAYVDAELATDAATADEIVAGCEDYVRQKNM